MLDQWFKATLGCLALSSTCMSALLGRQLLQLDTIASYAWLSQAPLIVLECVVEASSSQWVKQTLQAFEQQTKMVRSEVILNLGQYVACTPQKMVGGFLPSSHWQSPAERITYPATGACD